MITGSEATWQAPVWQDELKQLITRPEPLLEYLQLEQTWLPEAIQASAHFPLRVTPSYVSRIKKGDIHDPLLRQVLPLGAELHSPEDYVADPLQEANFNPVPGIVHKYTSRVLLIAATQCAINCRYCFRRAFPYSDNQLNKAQWQNALEYIRQQTDLNEVILSGGDPLAINDGQILWCNRQLAAMPHIRRMRVHTRLPVVLPSRITDGLIEALTATRLKPVVVIHCNHPQEVDSRVAAALLRLKRSGITVLNQAVLLKKVNDDSKILAELSEVLFDSGVLPYYLHTLDPVTGAAHFAVDLPQAKKIYSDLLAKLPGFLVPKLVQEIPNQPSKTPVSL